MSDETIMLAKNLDLKKIQYPCAASEKLDGVPGVFRSEQQATIHKVSAITRQGEPIKSVDHIRSKLYGKLNDDCQLIGELHIEGLPFKDISGFVRRDEQCPQLVLNVWDYFIEDEPDMTYSDRRSALMESDVGKFIYDALEGSIRIIPGKTIQNEEELTAYCADWVKAFPESEGLIFRPLHGKHSLYNPGKRSWGFQRFKAEETVDLRLVGMEEAIDAKTGKGNGMVGRLICEYKGRTIGVGPGALKHGERIALWQIQKDRAIGRIIEVAYKPDPSYEALREARFKRFRDDKTKPNIE